MRTTTLRMTEKVTRTMVNMRYLTMMGTDREVSGTLSASSSRNTVRVSRAKIESPIFSPWGAEEKAERLDFARRQLHGIIGPAYSRTGFWKGQLHANDSYLKSFYTSSLDLFP